MKTMTKNGVSLCSLAGCMLLAACSSEGEIESPTRVDSVEQSLEAVPDDGGDFQSQMGVDKDGNVTPGPVTKGAGILVPDFDPASLGSKPVEVSPPRRSKIAPSLAKMLRVDDPKAVTEVVVSVAHDAPFSPLPKLRRDHPRTSTDNTQRLAARVNAIAAVDARRKPFRTAVANHAKSLRGVVTEELTMGNALAIALPDSAVQALANHPDVLEIVPRYDGTPPPATISNGTSLATGMNSDYWRPWSDGDLNFFYMVAFDTGLRSTHTMFTSPDGGSLGLHRDCSRGNSSCLNSPVNPAYDDQDTFWNHGTGAASIMIGGNSASAGFGINFRGVSRAELDYLNVYSNLGSDAVAVSRAFLLAANFGDDVIVGELQMSGSDSSAASLAADDAFDQGIATISACGNVGAVTSPASPGNAHKALSVGDYDAVTGTTTFQVPGFVDNRIKPDFQTPTTVDAAGNGSNTAKRLGFNGTSGATAFAGGAAALLYEWYATGHGITNKPGNLYTALLAQGDGAFGPNFPNGAGRLKMESGSWWWTGQITLGTTTQDLIFAIPASRKNLKVAIWWPERQSDAHNDIDLVVLNPSGGTVGTSLSAGSVWEKVRQTGNLTPGNYTVRFVPFSMPRPSQVVYYTVIASYQ